MLTAFLTFLSSLPVIGGMVQAVMTAMFDAKVKITTARIGGDTTVATELVKAAAVNEHSRVDGLRVIAGSKALMFLVVGFATPFMIYVWKVVVHDIVLMLGSTDAIHGNVAEWGNTIIVSIFGSGTLITLGSMYYNRKQT